MSSSEDSQGPPQEQGPYAQQGPPYAPRYASLGGLPDVIPDIPATAVFLFLYLIFAVIHIKLFKKNKARGHKFVFSGALFGFSKIRIVTMSLRIAWACYPRNISLGIAAQVFVYVGTIILYIVNWFFTQRIVRARHPHFGWSTPYRLLHRGALVCLVLCLLMIVVGAIHQFFTLDENTLRIDRNLQLTGQTYFAVFCAAPLYAVTLSLLIPKKQTEKFGSDRLGNNIAILLTAAFVLSAGQIFRCATAWLPQIPSRTEEGRPVAIPWYLSKASFYVFNFTTEIFVVMFYAIVRVDLRFYIPDGSKKPGDYSQHRKGKSPYHVDVIGNGKNLKRASTVHPNDSGDTLHEYESSIFDDSRTLANSLKYPSSTLEIDPKSGNWKIKRMSQSTSMNSLRQSLASEATTWDPDRNTYVNDDAPPVPELPTDWPLRDSQIPTGYTPAMEHTSSHSRSQCASKHSNELQGHGLNGVDMSNAIVDALAKLEANGQSNHTAAPPDYDAITPVERQPGELPHKKSYQSQRPYSDFSKKHPNSSGTSSTSPPKKIKYIPTNTSSSDLAQKHNYAPQSTSSDFSKQRDDSAQVSVAGTDISPRQDHPPSTALSPDGREDQSFSTAEEEFQRFSFESRARREEEGYQGNNDDGSSSEYTFDLSDQKKIKE